MANQLVFKWFSVLLCYPEQALIDALPELREALNNMPEIASKRTALAGFLDHLAKTKLLTLQEDYVQTFDRNRSHALYIFEHIHGEDRDRGAALVDLLEEYRKYGLELGDDELPDYLPALLEFLAEIAPQPAFKLLGDAVHVINHIAQKLAANGSPYAVLLQTLVMLSPVKPLPLIEPPVRDMDEAMETFGADMTGAEPLLNRSLSDRTKIRFYPEGAHKQHQGAE
ncbi:nitrate reductase molybdenum cofactor assembly chaperone [Necropsobacter rosorum]|uniref:nitrate reductase molybdenum cofactor assembly chaperone n=1 Tax=Necropsobacter rosorum TaxID=908285 RepID=UPI000509420D